MLLDLMMPMKSGWDVLDELKKLPAGARPVVIVLTAGNEPRDLDPSIVAGIHPQTVRRGAAHGHRHRVHERAHRTHRNSRLPAARQRGIPTEKVN